MNLLVIGEEEDANECRQKFGGGHTYMHESVSGGISTDRADVIFDFLRRPKPYTIESYKGLRVPAFFNTTVTTLRQLNHPLLGICHFGFAGLPTFMNREILEVSLHQDENHRELGEVCRQLGTAFQTVDDRVGLVTPRVICMIINEAYFAFEDGTASREDIDLAMKLGTHYPLGPFEWSRKIGLHNVCELLDAVYADSKDERYKVCPLLRKELLIHLPQRK